MGSPYRPRPRDNVRRVSDQPTYFVPSLSVRRPASLDDERVLDMQSRVREVLGRKFTVAPPSEVGLTVIERRKFVERVRAANASISPRDLESLSLSMKDSLARLLQGSVQVMEMPVGRVERFGARQNKLGFFPLGWRGFRSRYAELDEFGNRLPLGLVVAEQHVCLGAISTAFSEEATFQIDGLVRNPHIVVASQQGKILDKDMRHIRDDLEAALPETVPLGDPVILPKMTRSERNLVPIYVRT